MTIIIEIFIELSKFIILEVMKELIKKTSKQYGLTSNRGRRDYD
jgi:hypothetical protein